MDTRKQFWERVNAVLDQRNDPFEDPDLQSYLMENPEEIEELTALCSGLDRLVSHLPAPARNVLPIWLTLVAASLVGALLWISWDPNPPPTREKEAANLQAGIILEFNYKITVTTPEGEETLVLHRDRWTSTQREVVEQNDESEHGSVGPTSIVCVNSGHSSRLHAGQ